MPANPWYQHSLDTVRTMLCTCIGTKWGDAPEQRLDEIRNNRYTLGKKLCRQLGITSDDTVLDFGSGCGFVTRAFCENAARVHCADLNPEFLDFTRDELSMFPNTQFHHIDYASIPDLPDKSIDKAVSTAVFIHFLYYDILFNLIELNRVLKAGGLLYFDIIDADAIELEKPAAIGQHIKIYKQSVRGDGFMVQASSLTAVKKLVPQLGFECIDTNHIGEGNNIAEIVLRKVRDADLPEWLRSCI